jgi:hypothetical protein
MLAVFAVLSAKNSYCATSLLNSILTLLALSDTCERLYLDTVSDTSLLDYLKIG